MYASLIGAGSGTCNDAAIVATGASTREHSVGKRLLDVNVERLPKLARVRADRRKIQLGTRAGDQPPRGRPTC